MNDTTLARALLFAGTISALGAASALPSLAGTDPAPIRETDDSSPVLGIVRDVDPRARILDAAGGVYRTIDGSGNNLARPLMGSAGSRFLRPEGAAYADGLDALAGATRLGPRAVSNIVCPQPGSRPNRLGASDMVWQWGQFLDHDLDLTDGVTPPEHADIAVPRGDRFFDPAATGSVVMSFNRSIYDLGTGGPSGVPRQQLDEITSWIDASQVYGSDDARARALRTLSGGHMKMSAGGLPPFNTDGLANAGGPSPSLFACGDVRANEQLGLLAMHALFLREHERLVREIRAQQPLLPDEELYQRARRIVGAEMQAITYREFLPVVLGPGTLAPYAGYKPNVDAGIRNVFATASYRFGHSALNATLWRRDAANRPIPQGDVPLRDAFFTPGKLVSEGGIDPLLRGLVRQRMQAIDPFVVDDVRNFLFGEPGEGGFDLASLNIQRGRDHGLLSYNAMRRAMGLRPKANLGEISVDPLVRQRLATAYRSVEDVDAWVGGLAEDPRPGALVGELVSAVLKAQFEALRDGDRYWYQLTLTPGERDMVERSTLAAIIRRNTSIRGEIGDDAFHAPPPPMTAP